MFARVRNHTRYDRNKLIMYKKGIGPNSLGSPLKQVMSSDEINQALRTKREKTGTGGITMDNSLVGLPGVGTVAKAGIKKAASKTAGKWTGRKTGAIADAGVQFHGLISGK